MIKIKHILPFVLLAAQFLIAQSEYKFETISIPDGLSSNEVTRIFQDSKGFIWIGTRQGLNKYDGYKITVYQDEPEDSTSLNGDEVFIVHEDENGDVWVGTNNALNKYNPNADNFKSYQYDPSSTIRYFNGVFDIYQDSKGNFWIGAAFRGLTTFNRETEQFEQVSIEESIDQTDPYAVFSFAEDKDGNLWYIRVWNNFANHYKVSTDLKSEAKIEIENVDENDKDFRTGQFIIADEEGNIWSGTENGYLLQYNKEKNKYEGIKLVEDGRIRYLTFDNDGNTWVTTRNKGLIKYSDEKLITQFQKEINNNEGIPSNSFGEVFIDASGIIWLASRDLGAIRFDPNKKPFELYRVLNDNVNQGFYHGIFAFAESKVFSNEIWFAAEMQLYRFNKITKEVIKHDVQVLEDRQNRFRIIRDLVEHEGNLWIGTLGAGLYKLDLASNQITEYKADLTTSNALQDNDIRTLELDNDNRLWIGTNEGLAYLNLQTEEFKNFKRVDSLYSNEFYNKVGQLKNNILADIHYVDIFKDTTVAFTVNEQTDVLIHVIGEMISNQGGVAWDYGWLEDNSGNIIWMPDTLDNLHAGGAEKNRTDATIIKLEPGIYKLRYKADDSHGWNTWNDPPPLYPKLWGIFALKLSKDDVLFFENSLTIIEKDFSIHSENIRTLYKDSKGNIFVGTNDNGFSVFDGVRNTFKNYRARENNNSNFRNTRINAVFEYEPGVYFLGGNDGINIYNSNDETFEHIKINTNFILDFQKDEHGDLWIATLRGLIKMNIRDDFENSSFTSYDIIDGLQGYVFHRGVSLKDEQGRMYFGGENGFNIITTGSVNNFPPKVAITDFQISNEKVVPGEPGSPIENDINFIDEMELDHSQNILSFEFVALHYSRPNKNQYAYKLEGFDDNWIFNNRQYASYTNLEPGDYVFKVKAANADGVWNENPKEVKIKINSPWWRTIYAYAGYVLFAIIGFVGFDKIQKKRIVTKERERAKIQEAELRAAAAEAQSRAIQAENDRKTKELEEARNLQLSMLPKEIPAMPELDIAVYMRTATEVGGDYYDFNISMDGGLTIVVGDATGHGLNAGTMVTATKSLFNSHANNPDILYSLKEIGRCLKLMKFRLLSMCLSIAKINGNEFTVSSAGMPPTLIYRASENSVDEILLKGMPLGVHNDFPYKLEKTNLNYGDTVLMMSDGFPELFDKNGEILGYKKTEEIFKACGYKSANEIIDYFASEMKKWIGDEVPQDDVTFVVVKYKKNEKSD